MGLMSRVYAGHLFLHTNISKQRLQRVLKQVGAEAVHSGEGMSLGWIIAANFVPTVLGKTHVCLAMYCIHLLL